MRKVREHAPSLSRTPRHLRKTSAPIVRPCGVLGEFPEAQKCYSPPLTIFVECPILFFRFARALRARPSADSACSWRIVFAFTCHSSSASSSLVLIVRDNQAFKPVTTGGSRRKRQSKPESSKLLKAEADKLTCPGGETGRRTGLKIPSPERDVPVRFRSRAPRNLSSNN